MASRLFRAREIREGATPEDLRRQLNEAFKLIERDIGAALSSSKVSEVITASTYAPGFGEVARVAPPSTGLALILPEPNLAQLDARVTVVQEAASGAMTVEVVNGTINGAATLAYLAGVGTVEFILTPTGWYAWSVSLVASLPLTALAAQAANTIVANATGSSASPTPVAVSADSLLARVGGNLVSHPWSTVAGAGLSYSAGALAVTGSTSITVASDEVRRAALTGEATAGTNDNAVTVTRSTDYSSAPWTGDHKFSGALLLGTLHTNASSGSLNVTLTAGSTRLLFSHATANITLGTVSGCADGRLLVVEFVGTGTHTVTHDATSADAFGCPGDVNLVITGRGGFVAVGRQGTNANWKIVATTN